MYVTFAKQLREEDLEIISEKYKNIIRVSTTEFLIMSIYVDRQWYGYKPELEWGIFSDEDFLREIINRSSKMTVTYKIINNVPPGLTDMYYFNQYFWMVQQVYDFSARGRPTLTLNTQMRGVNRSV